MQPFSPHLLEGFLHQHIGAPHSPGHIRPSLPTHNTQHNHGQLRCPSGGCGAEKDVPNHRRRSSPPHFRNSLPCSSPMCPTLAFAGQDPGRRSPPKPRLKMELVCVLRGGVPWANGLPISGAGVDRDMVLAPHMVTAGRSPISSSPTPCPSHLSISNYLAPHYLLPRGGGWQGHGISFSHGDSRSFSLAYLPSSPHHDTPSRT